MPIYQRSSTYETSADVFRGSAAVSISRYQESPSYVAVGAHVGLTITRNLEISEETVDDAQGISRVFKDEFNIVFDRFETLKDTINRILHDACDDFTNVAGTLVEDATEAVTATNWGYNDPHVVEHQNGSLAQLTINSVTGSEDGLLVADTDYYIGQDDDDNTVVTIVDSATVTTETQTMTINYDYTPNASVTREMGGGTELNQFIVRIIGKNDGRQVQYDFWNVQRAAGGEITFAKDDAEDRRSPSRETWLARADYTYHDDGGDGAYVGKETINVAS